MPFDWGGAWKGDVAVAPRAKVTLFESRVVIIKNKTSKKGIKQRVTPGNQKGNRKTGKCKNESKQI